MVVDASAPVVSQTREDQRQLQSLQNFEEISKFLAEKQMGPLFPELKKEDFEDDSDGTKVAELKYKVGNVS